ncbi:MAG: alpha/beta hydrolase [Kiritimatiellae bacterium]|nr:alpha/beta hydrolase [Kiritimatiellia bacterium]
MKKSLIMLAAAGAALALNAETAATNTTQEKTKMDDLQLTQEWDKTFPKSDKVEHSKVTFRNRYGITLAADMYVPKAGNGEQGTGNGKLPAIAVSGPFGAVKEQTSGVYAQNLAERGFITIAFDPSFTGESGGEPRRMASPDINTEDFLAAVDFLSVQPDVDPGRIGIVGICGWGGMAVSAAALDPRIKATVASTMYDMTKVTREGYFGAADTTAKRMAARRAMAAQRTADYKAGPYKRAGGVIDPLPEDAPWFVKDYHAYYKTPRGYHERSGNSTDGWNVIGCQSFLNQPLLAWAHEIESPVLLIHGEKAHSRYFSEYAFEKMTGKNPDGKSITVGNKELMIIPDAVHTDLYDDKNNRIPYDKMEAFFRENLK